MHWHAPVPLAVWHCRLTERACCLTGRLTRWGMLRPCQCTIMVRAKHAYRALARPSSAAGAALRERGLQWRCKLAAGLIACSTASKRSGKQQQQRSGRVQGGRVNRRLGHAHPLHMQCTTMFQNNTKRMQESRAECTRAHTGGACLAQRRPPIIAMTG